MATHYSEDAIESVLEKIKQCDLSPGLEFESTHIIQPDLEIVPDDNQNLNVEFKQDNFPLISLDEDLEKLVKNGPDVHPGAKILERKNGDNISLRYVDRDSLELNIGDIVHRHMMDGDPVLFNRQPTLHRMSMMCHKTVIMPKGDTFRMNVGDTKPYNADFDGDEMNMHMPQDIESETELKNLAAIPYQIISPANNQSIIGIF